MTPLCHESRPVSTAKAGKIALSCVDGGPIADVSLARSRRAGSSVITMPMIAYCSKAWHGATSAVLRRHGAKSGGINMPFPVDVREKVLEAIRNGMSCRQAAAHFAVSVGSATKWAREAGVGSRRAPLKISDNIRKKVVKAIAGGMSCKKAAATYGIDSTTAARFADDENIDRKRDKLRMKVLSAIRSGMSRRQAAAYLNVSVGSATRWAKRANIECNAAPVRHGRGKRERVLEEIRNGLTLNQAAEYFGVHIGTLHQWIKQTHERST